MKKHIYTRRHLTTIDIIGCENMEKADWVYRRRYSQLIQSTDGATRTIIRRMPRGVFRFYVFDLYRMEELSIFQKCKCYLRDWFTTTFGKKSPHTCIIEITFHPKLSLVSWTNKASYQIFSSGLCLH